DEGAIGWATRQDAFNTATRLIKSPIDGDDDVDAPIVRNFSTSSTARLQFLELNGSKARNARGSPIRVFPVFFHIPQSMASCDSKERQPLEKLGSLYSPILEIMGKRIGPCGCSIGVPRQVPIRVKRWVWIAPFRRPMAQVMHQ